MCVAAELGYSVFFERFGKGIITVERTADSGQE